MRRSKRRHRRPYAHRAPKPLRAIDLREVDSMQLPQTVVGMCGLISCVNRRQCGSRPTQFGKMIGLPYKNFIKNTATPYTRQTRHTLHTPPTAHAEHTATAAQIAHVSRGADVPYSARLAHVTPIVPIVPIVPIAPSANIATNRGAAVAQLHQNEFFA